MGLVSEPLPPQGVGDRELPLPPRLHHHAHPLNGARVSSECSLSHNKVASPETNKGQGSECAPTCALANISFVFVDLQLPLLDHR